MSNSDDNVNTEISIVLLGSTQKTILFDKLCDVSAKYERHVHYQDVHYLSVDMGDGRLETTQITDPGLARTGGREMAIRRADVAILFYSACSLNSLQQLKKLKPDLDRRKNLPIRLICDMDEITEEEEDGGSTGISSLSEGYESDTEREGLRRRPSMEKMRRASEEGNVSLNVLEGKEFAASLGESCVFIQMSSSRYGDADTLLRDLVMAARNKKSRKSRSLIPALARRSKSRDAKVSPPVSPPVSADKPSTTSVKSVFRRRRSVQNSQSTQSEPASIIMPDGTPRRKNSDVKNSKVCVVM